MHERLSIIDIDSGRRPGVVARFPRDTANHAVQSVDTIMKLFAITILERADQLTEARAALGGLVDGAECNSDRQLHVYGEEGMLIHELQQPPEIISTKHVRTTVKVDVPCQGKFLTYPHATEVVA